MLKCFNVIVLYLFAVFSSTNVAHAQMGWSKAQVERKYGKPIHVFQGVYFMYDLPKSKFPGLYSSGLNQITFQYYQGKVAELSLTWAGYKLSGKESATMNPSNDSDPTVIKMRAYDAKYQHTMQYEMAKEYALSYMDDTPDPKAIKNEDHNSSNRVNAPNLWPGEATQFDYKGWHFIWGIKQYSENPVLYNQNFRIIPAANTSLDNELKAVEAQRSASIGAEVKIQQRSAVRKETR